MIRSSLAKLFPYAQVLKQDISAEPAHSQSPHDLSFQVQVEPSFDPGEWIRVRFRIENQGPKPLLLRTVRDQPLVLFYLISSFGELLLDRACDRRSATRVLAPGEVLTREVTLGTRVLDRLDWSKTPTQDAVQGLGDPRLVGNDHFWLKAALPRPEGPPVQVEALALPTARWRRLGSQLTGSRIPATQLERVHSFPAPLKRPGRILAHFGPRLSEADARVFLASMGISILDQSLYPSHRILVLEAPLGHEDRLIERLHQSGAIRLAFREPVSYGVLEDSP